MKRFVIITVLILSLGCAKSIRPGAVDVADSRAFDVLGTAAITIEALKQECPSGPTSPCPQSEKDAINHLIDAYNVSRLVWLDYRALRLAGKPANAEQLATAMTQVILAIDSYRKALHP